MFSRNFVDAGFQGCVCVSLVTEGYDPPPRSYPALSGKVAIDDSATRTTELAKGSQIASLVI